MKTREREIARAGIFGSTDNPVVVKESDLEEIAQTFPEQKTVPIKLGSHYTEDRPLLPGKPQEAEALVPHLNRTLHKMESEKAILYKLE